MTTAQRDENPTIISSAISLPEGPLLMPDGSWLVVELDPRRGVNVLGHGLLLFSSYQFPGSNCVPGSNSSGVYQWHVDRRLRRKG